MGVNTEKYIRKPLYVDAVRVTEANFNELTEWCQGELEFEETKDNGPNRKYIRVRVHNPKGPRQTKAFVGDWILYTDRGYKIYTNKAFKAAFDPVVTAPERVTTPPSGVTSQSGNGGYAATGDGVVITTPTTSSKGRPEDGLTPQGEPIEVVPATAQAIADVVNEQQPVSADDGVHVSGSPTAPPVTDDTGKRIITIQEQQHLTALEVRELVSSGEAILEQDLAA